MEEITKEQAAAIVEIALSMLDNALIFFDTEKLTSILNLYQNKVGILEAMPFPGTMNRADEMKLDIRFLKAVIELKEVRKAQQNYTKRFMDDEMILKKLGF